MAERVGFEPTKGYKPLLVFKTSAFDHSATSPNSFFFPAGGIDSLALLTHPFGAHFVRPIGCAD